MDSKLIDIFQQLELLIFRRKCIVEYKQAPDLSENPRLKKAFELNLDEVKPSISLLQNYLVEYGSSIDPAKVSLNLLDVAKKYGRMQVVGKKKKESKKPSKQDKLETVDDKSSDDSVEFFILQTLRKMMARIDARNEPAVKIDQVNKSCVKYCFEHLKFEYSPAIRHEASLDLGYLSFANLKEIVELFSNRLTSLKKSDEARNYVPYQRAVEHMSFSLNDQMRYKITLTYLSNIRTAMSKIDRGVLKEAICMSLSKILPKCVEGCPAALNSDGFREFWENYFYIYTTIIKWSKNKKHTTFCYKAMQKLIVNGNIELFRKGEQFVQMMCAGVKGKDLRVVCMEGLTDYFSNANDTFINMEPDTFTNQVDAALSFFFSGKKSYQGDDDLLTKLVIEISKKKIDIALRQIGNTLVHGILEHRLTLFSALAFMSENFPTQIHEQNQKLAAVICNTAMETKESGLLAGAIGCFPAIRPANKNLLGDYVKRIGKLTLHPDRSVASAAVAGLKRYALLDPERNLLTVASLMIRSLLNPLTPQEELVKSFSHFTELLSGYIEYVQGGTTRSKHASLEGIADEDTEEDLTWKKTRILVEGMVLLWSTSSELWVKNESFRLLKIFSQPEIRQLEKDLGGDTLVLFDVLKSNIDEKKDLQPFSIGFGQSEPQVKETRLASEMEQVDTHDAARRLVEEDYNEFAESIKVAWEAIADSMMFKDVERISQDPMQFDVWKLKLEFLCLGLRVGEKFAIRPEKQKIEEFFTSILKIHLGKNLELACLVRNSCQLLHTSCLDPLLVRLRRAELMDVSGKIKVKGTEEEAPREFFVKPTLLEMMSKLIKKMTTVYMSESQNAEQHYTELISSWLDESVGGIQLFEMAPSSVKSTAANILERYIELNGIASIVPGKEVGSAIRLVYLFLSGLLPPLKGNDPGKANRSDRQLNKSKTTLALLAKRDSAESKRQLQNSVLKAMVFLFKCGQLGDPRLEEEIYGFIIGMLYRGEHTLEHVADSLTSFLSQNPHYTRRFTIGAFQPERRDIACDDSTVSRWSLCHVQLQALVSNFAENLDKWLVLMKLPITALLAIATFQMCSPFERSRVQAIRLAQVLAHYDKFPLAPQTSLPVKTHMDAYGYSSAALQYSAEISNVYIDLTLPLVEEVVGMIESMSLLFQCQAIKLIVPWMRNIQTLLKQNKKTEALAVLNYLLFLTNFSIGEEVLIPYIEEVWIQACLGNVLEGGDDGGKPEDDTLVVDFVLKHLFAFMPDCPVSVVEKFRIGKAVCAFLSRTPLGHHVAQFLFASMKNYTDEIPEDTSALVGKHASLVKQEDIISVEEFCSFRMAVDVVFEANLNLVPYLPLLLQNIFGLLGPTFEGECEDSLTMISNLLHTLIIRLAPNSKMRDAASLFLEKYFPTSHEYYVSTFKKYRKFSVSPDDDDDDLEYLFPPSHAKTLCDALSVHRSNIQTAWADLAWRWMVLSSNTFIVRDAVLIFSQLTKQINLYYTNGLAVVLIHAHVNRQRELCSILIDATIAVSERIGRGEVVISGADVLIKLTALGSALLYSTKLSSYMAGLDILKQILKLEGKPVGNDVIYDVIMTTLGSDETTENLAEVFKKGLTRAETIGPTFKFLIDLGLHYCGRGLVASQWQRFSHLFLAVSLFGVTGMIAIEGNYKKELLSLLAHLQSTEAKSLFSDIEDHVSLVDDDGRAFKGNSNEDAKFIKMVVTKLFSTNALVGTEAHIAFSIDFLLYIASKGLFKQRILNIIVLKETVAKRKSPWLEAEYDRISDVIVEFAYSMQEEVSLNAIDILNHLLAATVEGSKSVKERMQSEFNFIRKPPEKSKRLNIGIAKEDDSPYFKGLDSDIGDCNLVRVLFNDCMGVSGVLPKLDNVPEMTAQQMLKNLDFKDTEVVVSELLATAEAIQDLESTALVGESQAEPAASPSGPVKEEQVPGPPPIEEKVVVEAAPPEGVEPPVHNEDEDEDVPPPPGEDISDDESDAPPPPVEETMEPPAEDSNPFAKGAKVASVDEFDAPPPPVEETLAEDLNPFAEGTKVASVEEFDAPPPPVEEIVEPPAEDLNPFAEETKVGELKPEEADPFITEPENPFAVESSPPPPPGEPEDHPEPVPTEVSELPEALPIPVPEAVPEIVPEPIPVPADLVDEIPLAVTPEAPKLEEEKEDISAGDPVGEVEENGDDGGPSDESMSDESEESESESSTDGDETDDDDVPPPVDVETDSDSDSDVPPPPAPGE